MTFRTVHILHLRLNNLSVGMAVQAKLLFRGKLVQIDGVTGGALDISLEPVQRMPCGVRYFFNNFFPFPMALNTEGTGDKNFSVWTFGNLFGLFEKGFNEHLVFFNDGRIMAVMTFDAFMNAGFPGGKRRLHDMATDTKLGVVLGVVIQI